MKAQNVPILLWQGVPQFLAGYHMVGLGPGGAAFLPTGPGSLALEQSLQSPGEEAGPPRQVLSIALLLELLLLLILLLLPLNTPTPDLTPTPNLTPTPTKCSPQSPGPQEHGSSA